jgi:hypothetical protein
MEKRMEYGKKSNDERKVRILINNGRLTTAQPLNTYTMTIKDLVLAQKPQGINEWLEFIKLNKLEQYEAIILDCAEHFNLITVNHNATFENCL